MVLGKIEFIPRQKYFQFKNISILFPKRRALVSVRRRAMVRMADDCDGGRIIVLISSVITRKLRKSPMSNNNKFQITGLCHTNAVIIIVVLVLRKFFCILLSHYHSRHRMFVDVTDNSAEPTAVCNHKVNQVFRRAALSPRLYEYYEYYFHRCGGVFGVLTSVYSIRTKSLTN